MKALVENCVSVRVFPAELIFNIARIQEIETINIF